MIKRKLFSALKAHVGNNEITLITGPRQAGKTTLMIALKKDLETEGRQTFMANLDIEADRQFFSSQTVFVQRLELSLGKKGGVVFVDEIQRKENAGLFLKGLYDMNLPYKFVVSGSGSLELKERIHESLTGRKRIFELGTLSFEEFADFRTNYEYENNLAAYLRLDGQKSYALLKEYMQFGGYPKAVLAEGEAEKYAVINEIFGSYVEKDIAYLLRIKKTEDFIKLVKILAAQSGKLVNVAELSRMLGLAAQTIQLYLWYLEKTFLLKKVLPYWKNVRKEITKAPVCYFTDLGLRNFALGKMAGAPDVLDEGFVFQNFVYRLLADGKLEDIHFWRTKQGGEIDFVLEHGNTIIPVEVKFQSLKIPTITRALGSFIKQYRCKKAYVVNLSLNEERTITGCRVIFLPYHELLARNFAGKML